METSDDSGSAPEDAARAYDVVLTALAALRRHLVLLTCAGVLLQALAVGLAIAITGAVAEAVLFLPSWGRVLIALLTFIGSAVVLVVCLGRRLATIITLHRLGLYVENRYPILQQRLISTLELWDNQRARQLYSLELLALTVSRTAATLSGVRTREIADLGPLKTAGRNLAIVMLVSIAAFSLSTTAIRDAVHRLSHPFTPFARQAGTTIEVSPGDEEIVKGNDSIQTVRFGGYLPATATIQSRPPGATTWQEEEIVVEGADSLVYAFSQLRQSLDFRIRANDGVSRVQRIEVIDPPAVQHQRLEYHYPDYSKLPVRVEEETGDVHALAGTRVQIAVVASKPLRQAALVVNDTLVIHASVEDDRAEVELTLDRPGFYRIDLVDNKGITNPNPIRHAIHVVEDTPPQVTVTTPGRDVDLTDDQQVLVVAEVVDDFGIGSAGIHYRINDGAEQRIPLPAEPASELRLVYTWDLTGAELLPEDRVTYRVEAFDNDAVAGPKSGKSREFVLRFPSLYELYEEVVAEQDDQLEGIEELAEEGRDNREYLEQVRREMLKTEELSWEQKRELEATLGREEQRADALEELARDLEETLGKMEENDLVPEEVLEVVEEIRRLMSEVASPELRQALEAVQQATENLTPGDLAEALQQFNQSQEEFQERLDVTLALLRKVRTEQQLEAVVQKAEDLLERQETIDEELASGGDEPHLSEHEERVRNDTERLQEDLQELAQNMEQLSPKTAKQLTMEAASMEQSDLSGRMEEMVLELQAAETQNARRLGESLESDLGKLSASLQNMKGEYAAGEKEQIGRELRQAIKDLVFLSLAQERLQVRTKESGRDAAALLAQDQFALLQGSELVIERVGEVSRRTMSLDQGVWVTLGRARGQMQKSAEQLAERNTNSSLSRQQKAVQHLNEGALLLRESMENLAASKMPSSFGEAMQKMMGLSEQQADLNQATQQSLGSGRQPGKQGRQQPDFGELMSSLAARQRQIFQALKQLERSSRGHRGMQAKIQEMQNEMESVLGDLNRRRPSQNTLKSQERILQRMLEAGRSIHTRGFEEKRRSQAGADGSYAGPAWMPENLGQAEDLLRQAMKAAVQGDYPSEYRTVIRQYYETLYQELTGQPMGASQ